MGAIWCWVSTVSLRWFWPSRVSPCVSSLTHHSILSFFVLLYHISSLVSHFAHFLDESNELVEWVEFYVGFDEKLVHWKNSTQHECHEWILHVCAHHYFDTA
jgi:hypothetical protein